MRSVEPAQRGRGNLPARYPVWHLRHFEVTVEHGIVVCHVTQPRDLPTVSVVIPVKNGAGRLEHCLASLALQNYPRELLEVVVADGRSTDNTVSIARERGAKVVDNPRQTVAGGRNRGVAAATGTLIAFTDDDCVLPEGWLSAGVSGLLSDDYAAVGGPTPVPDGGSPWSRAVNRIFQAASRVARSVQSDRVHAPAQEVRDLPGGNAIYWREALERVLPVDEALLTAEDVDLHLRMRQQGMRLGFVEAFSADHKKRDSVRGFFRQMRRFAIGRVQLFKKHGQGMGTWHWGVAVAGAGAALGLCIQPGSLVLCVAGAWLLVSGCLLVVGEARATAFLVPPAALVFVAAWSVGVWSEVLLPLKDTTGK